LHSANNSLHNGKKSNLLVSTAIFYCPLTGRLFPYY
jgi:hypothetical protein